MNEDQANRNRATVLEAFDTLFNKHDLTAAEEFWSPDYVQHSAYIGPGRDGLFDLVRNAPDDLRHEAGVCIAQGDYVMVHGRFSGSNLPTPWIVVDIVRMENDRLVEHWDVIQDEATQSGSASGSPMFGKSFTKD